MRVKVPVVFPPTPLLTVAPFRQPLSRVSYVSYSVLCTYNTHIFRCFPFSYTKVVFCFSILFFDVCALQ